MGRIFLLTGAQTATNEAVQQRAAKLNVIFSTPDAQVADWATLKTRMNAVIVEVLLNNPNGAPETLIPKLPLGTLAEMYSQLEGYIDVTDNGTDHDVRFSIELSNEGALDLNEQKKIIINVTGMVANDRLDVYATDFPFTSRKAVKTTVLNFSANVAQGVSLGKGTHLHLPAASFDKLELFYPNGAAITLSKPELIQWALEGNRIAGVLVGVVTMGYIDFLTVNTVEAASAKVTQTSTVNGYLFNEIIV